MAYPTPPNPFELKTVLDALAPFLNFGSDKDFAFPVSRTCRATITFTTAPGIDEWDSFLAHAAFYKQWFKDEKARAGIDRDDLQKLIETAVVNARKIVDEGKSGP